MYGIDLLMEEHQNILRYTEMLRQRCCAILEGKEPDILELRECIEFGRNYADKQHHGKEEKILFRVMLKELGSTAEKLVRQGMLVEHDLGRYHMGELEQALARYEEHPSTEEKLSIIANAAGYADLLRRHIDKEDGVVFTYAMRSLEEGMKSQVDEETVTFEKESSEKGIQDHYLNWLKSKM